MNLIVVYVSIIIMIWDSIFIVVCMSHVGREGAL